MSERNVNLENVGRALRTGDSDRNRWKRVPSSYAVGKRVLDQKWPQKKGIFHQGVHCIVFVCMNRIVSASIMSCYLS